MKKTKTIILPSMLALAVLVVGILAASPASAINSNYPTLAQKIATHFNLNQSEVEEVFDEYRDERRAERYAFFAEKLNDLVADGKLTEEQKEEILEKHSEMQEKIDALKDLSIEERKEKMGEIRDEYRNWLESEGYDLGFGMFGKGMGMGRKMWMHRGDFEVE